MTPPDPRALVAEADPYRVSLMVREAQASLIGRLRAALSTALDRIAALTAPVDDARVREIEGRRNRIWTGTTPSRVALDDIYEHAPDDLAYLLIRVRALTAEVAGERKRNEDLRSRFYRAILGEDDR